MLQPPSPDELADLFAYVVSILERLSIPYMVVGGFAAITYGEPRQNDVIPEPNGPRNVSSRTRRCNRKFGPPGRTTVWRKNMSR